MDEGVHDGGVTVPIAIGVCAASVNGEEVKNLDEFNERLKNVKGNIYFDGIYPGFTESYRYPIKLGEE